MLKLDLRPGEIIRIGDDVVIKVEEKLGQLTRLSIQADKSVPITRGMQQSSVAKIAAEGGISAKE